jgi:SAM-dependent methyltransferase
MDEIRRTDPLRLTFDYYEQHADEFAQRTRDIDLSPLYEEFLPLLPPGGLILDAGCGTGRDSAVFVQRGFQVLAFDASKAMVDIASKRLGRPVLHISFNQMQFDHEFDGIWAAASLLHLPKQGMEWVFRDLHDALVPNGVLYASFKRGVGEAVRDGRFFNDYDEESLRAFVRAQRGWRILKLWRTEDIGQQRAGVEWVNLLARSLVTRHRAATAR